MKKIKVKLSELNSRIKILTDINRFLVGKSIPGNKKTCELIILIYSEKCLSHYQRYGKRKLDFNIEDVIGEINKLLDKAKGLQDGN